MTVEGIAEIEWRVEPARSGDPTLRIGGRHVHSRYDPVAEAHALATRSLDAMRSGKARFAVLIGAGLGYLPEILAERSETPLLVWDPFPRLTAALPEGARRSGTGSNVRTVSDAADFAAALHDLAPTGRPHLIVHPGYRELSRFEARFATSELRRAFRTRRPLWIEEAVVSRRALDALARFPSLPTLDRLEGCLADCHVAVVSPGPSLESALPALARRRGGVVVAAMQALRTLDEAGVRVDFAVAPDPGDYGPNLVGFEPRFDTLLADTAVEPGLLDRWHDRAYLFHLRSPHLQHVAWEGSGLPILDEPFVTVSEISLFLAHQLGARRFALVGVDLRSDEPRYPVRFWTRDLDGQVARTNSTYFHAARYLSVLCPRLRSQGCEVHRVGPGLPIEGARPLEVGALAPWLDASPAARPPRVSRGIEPERWKRACDLVASVRAGAGSHHWTTPRASGAHPDARDLEPLEGDERVAACRAALALLEQTRPAS